MTKLPWICPEHPTEISDEQIREIAEREVNPAYDENVRIIEYVTRVVRAVLAAAPGKDK